MDAQVDLSGEQVRLIGSKILFLSQMQSKTTSFSRPFSITAQHSIVWYGAVRCGTVRHGTARHGTVQYSTVQYSTV